MPKLFAYSHRNLVWPTTTLSSPCFRISAGSHCQTESGKTSASALKNAAISLRGTSRSTKGCSVSSNFTIHARSEQLSAHERSRIPRNSAIDPRLYASVKFVKQNVQTSTAANLLGPHSQISFPESDCRATKQQPAWPANLSDAYGQEEKLTKQNNKTCPT
jgi:hypothetical protein